MKSNKKSLKVLQRQRLCRLEKRKNDLKAEYLQAQAQLAQARKNEKRIGRDMEIAIFDWANLKGKMDYEAKSL